MMGSSIRDNRNWISRKVMSRIKGSGNRMSVKVRSFKEKNARKQKKKNKFVNSWFMTESHQV